MTGIDIIKDTEKKIKSILTRYYEILNSIEILEDTKRYLEDSLKNDDTIKLIEIKKSGMSVYNNDSAVEREAFYNIAINNVIEYKIKEIKAEIVRLDTAITQKKFVIDKIDKILASRQLDQDEKFLIKYCYIDKKYNKDSNNDIINRFNQGKKFVYTAERIYQIRDKAISLISAQFVSIRYRLNEV